jgi:hypothetical protein
LARFNEETANRSLLKPFRRGDAGCAAADDDDLNIAVRHSYCSERASMKNQGQNP